MGESRGVPALAMVALLVLAAATADEPSGPLDVAVSAEGQTPEPVSPAKLEASGESLTSGPFPGSPGVPGESPGSDSGPDGLDSGSVSADALTGGTRGGPILDVPSQSNESEEGVEHDMDSEEALASQGI